MFDLDFRQFIRMPELLPLLAVLGAAAVYFLFHMRARRQAVLPQPGTVPVGRAELVRRLLALNGPQQLFSIKKIQDGDLLVEDRDLAFRMQVALDESRLEARALGLLENAEVSGSGTAGRFFNVRISSSNSEGGGIYIGLGSFSAEDDRGLINLGSDPQELQDSLIATVTGAGWRFIKVVRPGQLRHRG